MPNLSREDGIYAADKIVSYFSKFNRIDDYFRFLKAERIKSIPSSLFGGPQSDLFTDYNMNPEDMNFKICKKPNAYFDDHLEIIASFSPDPAPGKTLKVVVQETNTGKDVGFIKFGSRADIYLPLNFNVVVKKGDKAVGGVTEIGRLN